MEIVKFGNLYLGEAPAVGGSWVPYIENMDISIRSTYYPNSPIEWVKVHDSLYVARTVLLTSISLESLGKQGYVYGRDLVIDGRRYIARMLRVGEQGELENILAAAGDDAPSLFVHEKGFYGLELVDLTIAGERRCTIWKWQGQNRCSYGTRTAGAEIGWCPVLEPLDKNLSFCIEHIGMVLSIRCLLSLIRGRLVDVTDYDLVLDCGKNPIIDFGEDEQTYRQLESGLVVVNRDNVMWGFKNI